jgi:hypothetical protein
MDLPIKEIPRALSQEPAIDTATPLWTTSELHLVDTVAESVSV